MQHSWTTVSSAGTRQSLIATRTGFWLLQLGLVGVALISVIVAVALGTVDVPISESYRILLYRLTGIQIGDVSQLVSGSNVNIIWNIRFPRVLLALLVGAGLSMCGTIMQATVQNPLADPYILGISSGASLGAAFSLMLGFGSAGLLGNMGLAFWAFAGAFGAASLVLALAGIGSKMSPVKLVLSGMVINALCMAFTNFIVYIAYNTDALRAVTFWSMGSLAMAKWDRLPLVAIVVVCAVLLFLLQFRILNAMLLGEEAAVTLGIQLNGYRRLYLVLTAFVTGVLVSASGTIGFIGLIIPHLVRGVVGSDHRRLMPTAILIGGIFLVWADVAARTIIPNTELPIGIITAIIGGPLFMYMLMKKNYAFGGGK